MGMTRIVAVPAAGIQEQVNQAFYAASVRIENAVTENVQAAIDETVAERVVALDSGRQGYVHEQVEPSTVWYVRHGLPFDPAAVEVTAGDGVRWWPAIDRTTPDVVLLLFPDPVAGTARLS